MEDKLVSFVRTAPVTSIFFHFCSSNIPLRYLVWRISLIVCSWSRSSSFTSWICVYFSGLPSIWFPLFSIYSFIFIPSIFFLLFSNWFSIYFDNCGFFFVYIFLLEGFLNELENGASFIGLKTLISTLLISSFISWASCIIFFRELLFSL